MGDVFVGIVEGPSPSTITVGIVQDGTRITGAPFAVEPAHLHAYYVPQADGRHRYEMPRRRSCSRSSVTLTSRTSESARHGISREASAGRTASCSAWPASAPSTSPWWVR
jgi:hypothetical protein